MVFAKVLIVSKLTEIEYRIQNVRTTMKTDVFAIMTLAKQWQLAIWQQCNPAIRVLSNTTQSLTTNSVQYVRFYD
jgi:hypothetical protein